jgi:hydroxymethylpyrimidine/phosphomethylpyrimidine kinase
MHLEHRFFASAWGGEVVEPLRSALTIAGSDPSGGAGIQADLKTFHRCGVYGQSVITLLTAQNTRGVQGVFVEREEVVRAQLRSVLCDIPVHAAKTGALGSVDMVRLVASELRGHSSIALVVDPVLISKHGHALAGEDVANALRELLLPICAVVTPNRFEAKALSGIAVEDEASACAAARAITGCGARAVVIKDVPGCDGDLLFHDGRIERFVRPSIATQHRHGSGCTFSAAITASLAKGESLSDACSDAVEFLARAIASAPGLGEIGPVNHWA